MVEMNVVMEVEGYGEKGEHVDEEGRSRSRGWEGREAQRKERLNKQKKTGREK